jgi:hypothetical protein
MGGIRTAKSSIQNCVGKRFAVWPENSSRSPKAGEGRVSVADIGPLFVIALHSPDGVTETGLCVCRPEKNARKPGCGVRRDTFSSAV